MTLRPGRSLATVLIAAALLGACGQSEDETPPADFASNPGDPGAAARVVSVTIPGGAASRGDRAFGDGPLQIDVGTTVTWMNGDSTPHTVTSTSGAFDSGAIAPGKSFSHRFLSTGEFPYYCAVGGMRGSVRVGAPSANDPRAPFPIPPDVGGGTTTPQPPTQPQPQPQPGGDSGGGWHPPDWWPWPWPRRRG